MITELLFKPNGIPYAVIATSYMGDPAREILHCEELVDERICEISLEEQCQQVTDEYLLGQYESQPGFSHGPAEPKRTTYDRE